MRRASIVIGGVVFVLAACDRLVGPSERGPIIEAIVPAVLSPADTARIIGQNFSPVALENRVEIAGVGAEVAAATATELRVVVPEGAHPCMPTTLSPVAVTVNGRESRTTHPVSGALRYELTEGESTRLGGGAGCHELVREGSYVISVYNTSTVPTSQSGFRLRGTAGGTAVQASPALADPPSVSPEPRIDREAETHAWLLAENLRIARELGGRIPSTARGRPEGFAADPIADDGATRTFSIPDLDSDGGLCGNARSVTARLAYSGPLAMIWEDVAAPLAGTMDPKWREVGEEYEQVMHPILLEYFGDPRAYDEYLVGGGRVNMLFSDVVNGFSRRPVAGFVFSGDLFPASSCAASDERALFYARVPTDPGSGYTGNTVDAWAWGMRATIMHEVKHIVAFSTRARLAAESGTGPSWESVWLMEAPARLAEELYGRALAGYAHGGNTTYEQSIWCERRVGPNFPACDRVPNIIYKHFGAVYSYYQNVEGLSPIGPATSTDWVVPTRPELTFPSWNTRDIMRGLYDDHRGTSLASVYPVPWPLRLRPLPAGEFDESVPSVRGGSAAFFQMTVPADGSGLLELLSLGGAAAPSNLYLAVVRVH